jgi:hypothetical protein
LAPQNAYRLTFPVRVNLRSFCGSFVVRVNSRAFAVIFAPLRLCVRFFCFEFLELLESLDSLDSFSSPFPLETVPFLP